jgi:hypothetical protein
MKNYIKLFNDTLERKDLDLMEKILYSIICSYERCYLKNSQFEIMLSTDERTVRRKIETLKKLKLIECKYFGRKNRFMYNLTSDKFAVISDTSVRSILNSTINNENKKEKEQLSPMVQTRAAQEQIVSNGDPGKFDITPEKREKFRNSNAFMLFQKDNSTRMYNRFIFIFQKQDENINQHRLQFDEWMLDQFIENRKKKHNNK